MSEGDREDLEARVARLEAMVAELLERPPVRRVPEAGRSLPGLRPSDLAPPGGRKSTGPRDGLADSPPAAGTLDNITPERWLAGAGIAFVVLALAFLLKLSFDRGWVTPALRLVAGGATGAALLGTGLWLSERRRALSQFLLGGAIAVFYLVGYGGYQLYGLIPYWIALSLMSTTTLLAIVLAEREDSSRLAVLGALGGFATPFLLDTGSGSAQGLAVYLTAILLGIGAVQLHRGWPVLLAVLGFAGGIVLALMADAVGTGSVLLPLVALSSFWIVTAVSPLVRRSLKEVDHPQGDRGELWVTRILAGWGTFMVALQLGVLFDVERATLGGIWLGCATVLALLGWAFRGARKTVTPATEVAAISGAIGIGLLLWSPMAIVLILGEVAVLLTLAVSAGIPSLTRVAHLLALAAGFALLVDGVEPHREGLLGLREGAFTRLVAVAVAAILGGLAGRRAATYRFAAYAGLLFWSLTELVVLPNGNALVSIAWAVQGAITLIWAIRSDALTVRSVGLGTLALVGIKLLLVDLSQLDPIWRVVLFLGFGAALLGLGYLINRSGPEDGAPEGVETGSTPTDEG